MALYHIAKGPVNYTVAGNPTIVDGVASGFSEDNHIIIAQLPLTLTTYKLEIDFTTGSAFTDFKSLILGTYNELYSSWGFLVEQNGQLNFNCYLSDGNSNAFFETYTDVTLQTNQRYYAELLFSKNEATITSRVSTDKVNWTTKTVSTGEFVQAVVGNSVLGIGKGQEGVFEGSVNLNNTYIKVNGQPWFGNCPVEVKRHQIMGPVGYTVVGSPMIKDGVMSSITSANYATSASACQMNEISQIDIKFSKSDITSTATEAVANFPGLLLMTTEDTFYWIVYKTDGADGLYASNGLLQQNTPIYVRYKVEGANLAFYYSTTGEENSYTLIGTRAWADKLATTSANTMFGYSSLGLPVAFGSGSIDFNYTKIYKNNELWFYQPQETKYIIREDKLVWADPRIYLRGDGNSAISLNSVFRTDHTYTIPFRLNETTPLADGAMFGSREGYANSSVIWCNSLQGYPVLVLTVYGGNIISIDYSKHILQMNTIAKLDNVQVDNAVNVSYNLPVGLFGFKQDGVLESRMFNGDIYSYTEIDENGNIIYELVPVPTGLVIGNFTVPSNGMFDIVNQQFYANQGTGEFTIGRDE